jgi:hypothetical protein
MALAALVLLAGSCPGRPSGDRGCDGGVGPPITSTRSSRSEPARSASRPSLSPTPGATSSMERPPLRLVGAVPRLAPADRSSSWLDRVEPELAELAVERL